MKFDQDLYMRQETFLDALRKKWAQQFDEEELDAIEAGIDYVMDNQDRFEEIGGDEAMDMGRDLADGSTYWRRHGGRSAAADTIYEGIVAAQRCCREVGVQR